MQSDPGDTEFRRAGRSKTEGGYATWTLFEMGTGCSGGTGREARSKLQSEM